jgi:translation initiation factor 2 gamma subunit (eIF-2gamma)
MDYWREIAIAQVIRPRFPVSADFSRCSSEIPSTSTVQPPILHKLQVRIDGMARALTTTDQSWENSMLSVYVENIGEMAVVQCEGRIVRSEAAFKLREAVCSQRDARIITRAMSWKERSKP